MENVSAVAWAPLDEIIRGKWVKAYRQLRTPQDGEAAKLRTRSQIGCPYDLIEANCEHSIQWAVTGKWRSEQVSLVKIGLLVAGTVAFAASLQPKAEELEPFVPRFFEYSRDREYRRGQLR